MVGAAVVLSTGVSVVGAAVVLCTGGGSAFHWRCCSAFYWRWWALLSLSTGVGAAVAVSLRWSVVGAAVVLSTGVSVVGAAVVLSTGVSRRCCAFYWSLAAVVLQDSRWSALL